METKQSEQIKQRVERELDDIVMEIARELRSCFERKKPKISSLTYYFHLMDRMGLVNSNQLLDSDLLFGNSYASTPSARRMYDGLMAEGFYEKPEFFWR